MKAKISSLLAAALLMLLLPLYSAWSADPIAFGPADSYAVASTPFRMAAGDFNKDGKPDVAVAHDNANYDILINNGDGTFTRTGLTTGSRLRDVAVVMLAGDTNQDLVFTDWTSFNLRVLTGNGSGGFNPAVTYATGGATDGIAAGDFNKDGYIDVAVAKRAASQVGVFLGTAGGGFNAIVNYGAGGAVMELAAGLVNGDTVLDLVTANWTSDNIGLLRGNGSGGFTAVTTTAAGNDNTDVALGDMDGDGKLDAVVANDGADGVAILRGDGLGGFTLLKNVATGNNPHQVRLADLNGNGLLDIATANRGAAPGLSVVLSYGYSHFTTAFQFHSDQLAYGLAISDFNPASLPDFVTAHGNNTARVIKGVMVDADADLLADADESYYFTNTALADTDGDLMPDGLEVKYWCLRPAVNNGGVDSDGDGPTNLAEYQAGTDPCNALADTDGDKMDNAWETAHACLNPAVADGNGDVDGDLITNVQEYRLNSDPCSNTDTDGDGMPDWWEDIYACVDSLVGDSTLDPDADTLDNLAEYEAGKDPCVVNDGDGDGMPDHWENAHACMQPGTADAGLDYDGDYRTNLAEYQRSTDPCAFNDTDGDLMPDGWEEAYACVDYLTGDSILDPDADTVDNLAEYLALTNPCVVNDGDGDGMPDHWEVLYGCMQPATWDAGLDYDSDYLTNLEEYQLSTNPCVFTDTDGDGMPDGWEELYACVDKLTGDSTLDPDADTKDNLDEYLALTNPCVVNDGDGDGMPDLWENTYGCMEPDTTDAGLDYDWDYLSNLEEYQLGDDPCALTDTDGDQMPDGWEELHTCIDGLVNDGDLDYDGDGAVNAKEYFAGSDPCVAESFWHNPVAFAAPTDHTVVSNGYRMASGDFNRDGWPDFVLIHSYDDYTIMMNNRSGGFIVTGYVSTNPSSRFRDVAVVTMAGDSIPDLIMTDNFSNVVYLFLGNGDGTFTQSAAFGVAGSSPSGLAAGDFNGDGWPDLAVCLESSSQIAVLLGNSGGSFNPATSYNSGVFCQELALGLVDGDGYLDVVTANFTNDSISVLLGNGAGGFGSPTVIAAGNDNTDVALGDINSDGALDAVVTASANNNVVLLLGNGLGGFSLFKTIAVGNSPRQVRLVDMNNNGLLDIVTANENGTYGLSVILSYGYGFFTGSYSFYSSFWARGLAFADVNCGYENNLPDIALAASSSVRLARSIRVDTDGDLVPDLDESSYGTSATDPDSDGDGLPDGFEVLKSCLDPAVADGTTDPDRDGVSNIDEYHQTMEPCIAPDADGDGMTDYWESLYPCMNGGVSDGDIDYDQDGVSNLNEYQQHLDPCTGEDTDGDGMPDGWEDLHACISSSTPDGTLDFDGDGASNLEEYNFHSDPCNAEAWWNYPVGWGQPIIYSAATAPKRMAAADLNKDGKQDLAVIHGSNNYTIFTNRWNGVFSRRVFSSGQNLDLVMVNLAGDTVADMVFTQGGFIRVMKGNGDGTFSLFGSVMAGSGAEGIAAGDFNNDGLVDVIVCNRTAQNAGLFLGNVSGSFNAMGTKNIGSQSCMELAAGNINADSNLDVMTANYTSDSISRLHGNGSGGFPSIAVTSIGNDNTDVALADLNGDGFTDAAVTASATNSVLILIGDGNGAFALTREVPVGPGPNQVRIADLNGDGWPDLAAANSAGTPGLSVVMGLGHGLFTDAYSFYTDLAANGLALAEFNADSLMDVATSHPDNTVRVLFGVAVDQDHDVLADAAEVLAGASISNPDTDGDGMRDGAEVYFSCLDPLVDDEGDDPDADWATSGQELAEGDNPCVFSDTDGDGMPNGWEILYACLNKDFADGISDADGDYLSNLEEFQLSTDPCVYGWLDTDGDLMPDGWEMDYACVDPMVGDSTADADSDTLDNLAEFLGLTDPCVAQDGDNDGMPDYWELQYACMNSVLPDAFLDGDGDWLYNIQEYVYGTDPCVWSDTDGDGMSDGWEDAYACVDRLAGDSTLDPDSDTLDNLGEYQAGTHPCVVNDADSDGMPDFWEDLYPCLNRTVSDAGLDPDADYLTNLTEFQRLTDPCEITDTDGDGMADGWEELYACVDPMVGDSTLDPDGDLADNLAEFQAGINPCDTDTDNDLLPDGWEVLYACVNPSAPDAGSDPDGDYLTNLQENQMGADPCVFTDTDGDLMPDGWELLYACVDRLTPDAGGDPDLDTFTNHAEYQAATDPCVGQDTDGDGASDVLELANGANPNDPAITPGYAANGPERTIGSSADHNRDVSLVWAGSQYGLAWENYDDQLAEGKVILARLSPEGAKLYPETTVSEPAMGGVYPALAWTGSEFAAAFNDYYPQLNFARVSAMGVQIGPGTRMSFVDYYSIASLAWTGSETGVCWESYDGGSPEIYFARIGPDGAQIGGDQRITWDNSAGHISSLAWTGSEFGVSWEDSRDGNGEIYFARIASDGIKIGSDQRITADGSDSISPSLAWTGTEFGLTWQDNREGNFEIFFARVSVTGSKVGGDLRMTNDAAVSLAPALVWTGSEYGLVLSDYRSGNYELRFAVLADTGAAVWPEKRITLNSGADNEPSLVWSGSEFGLGWDRGGTQTLFARLALDKDGDALPDCQETITNPLDWDSDDDTVKDGADNCPMMAGPQTDSDGDGIGNICDDDDDNDGLSDAYEATYGTNPTWRDTDGDWVDDGTEVAGGSNPLDDQITPGYPEAGREVRIADSGMGIDSTVAWTGSEFGVAWHGWYDLEFARMSAAGEQIGDKVVIRGVPDAGELSLTWTGSEFGLSYRDDYFYIAFERLALDGATMGSFLILADNDNPGILPSSLAWTGSEFGVCWEAYDDDEIMCALIAADGSTIGNSFQVTNSPGDCANPDLVWTGSEFGLVWQDNRDGNDEIYLARLSAEGNKIGGDVRLTYNTSVSQHPSLSWSGSQFGVSWQSEFGEIFFEAFGANGSFWEPENYISEQHGGQYNPFLAWAGFGYGLAWQQDLDWNGHDEIYFNWVDPWQVSGYFGFHQEFRLSYGNNDSLNPALAWTGSSFGVSWEDWRNEFPEIYFTVVFRDQDGDGIIDPDETATDPADWDTDDDIVSDGLDNCPAVANPGQENNDGDEQGNLCDPDDDNDGLSDLDEAAAGTLPLDPDTDNDGSPDGPEYENGSNPLDPAITPGAYKQGPDVRITNTSGDSRYPRLVWTGSEYGLAYTDSRPDTYVFFNRLSADGSKIGGDLQVTDYYGWDMQPELVWTGSEYALSWEDWPAVLFRRLSADGVRLGNEVEVTNQATTNYGSTKVSLVWSGSEFGVAWPGDAYSWSDMYFSRLSATGSKLGSDLRASYSYAHDPVLAWSGSEFGLSMTDFRYNLEGDCDPSYGSCGWELLFNRISSDGALIGDDLRITQDWSNFRDFGAPFEYYSPTGLVWTGSEYASLRFEDSLLVINDIIMSRILSEGARNGADINFTVHPETSHSPAALRTTNGMGVVWLDNRDTGGDTTEIYFSHLFGAGVKIAPDLRITERDSAKYEPSIAFTGSEFGVAWTDYTDNAEIYFTRIALDRDGDGLLDGQETVTNPGDWDTDDDTIKDSTDICPLDPANDADGDGVCGDTDNCPGVINPLQEDNDHDSMGDACDPDDDNDGLTDLDETGVHNTNPLLWDTDGDYLPDGYEVLHGASLDPLDPGDAVLDPDGDGNGSGHEYYNGSDPWEPDPAPTPGYEVGCYYWGKADGGPFVQPSDIVAMQKAYVGVSVDYSQVLPSQYDPMDLDRDMFPGPGDIVLAQGMYVGLPRPGGYVSSPIALTVEDAPVGPVAVGDTTHITVSVHAAGPAAEEFAPGMGVVFWVTSGNAALLGGEGTDPGEAAGNRYDISMKGADGAPANMVVVVTGPGPVVINAKVPGCGTEPMGRWCGEVGLASAVVVNP